MIEIVYNDVQKKLKGNKQKEKFEKIIDRLKIGKPIGCEHNLRFMYSGCSGIQLLNGEVLIIQRFPDRIELIDIVDYHKTNFRSLNRKI